MIPWPELWKSGWVANVAGSILKQDGKVERRLKKRPTHLGMSFEHGR